MSSQAAPLPQQSGAPWGLFIGLFVLFVVFPILVYVGYKYFSNKNDSSKCKDLLEDKKKHIATWIWDSNTKSCVANTCSEGYGTSLDDRSPDADGNCNSISKTYTEQFFSSGGSGVCGATSDGKKSVTTGTSDSLCRAECDKDTTCKGYDWTTTPVACNLYSTVVVPSAALAGSNCYST
jgi:hypothetical protein